MKVLPQVVDGWCGFGRPPMAQLVPVLHHAVSLAAHTALTCGGAVAWASLRPPAASTSSGSIDGLGLATQVASAVQTAREAC